MKVGPSEVGFMLAYVGLMSIVLRGIVLGKIIDLVEENTLILIGYVTSIIGLMLAAFVDNTLIFLGALTLFSFGFGILRPLLLGELSRNVSAKEQGTIMGLTNSLGSLAQIIGPFIGAFLINYFFAGSIGVMASLIMIVGLLIYIIEKKKFVNK